MSNVNLLCPGCGANLYATEAMLPIFAQLRCPKCGAFVDRRKRDRRGAVVAAGLVLTAEDAKLLREMGASWDDTKTS